MSGLELYVRFMFTLAVGLVGLGMVLTTVMETLFRDWDPVRAARRWWRQLAFRHSVSDVRAEDILMEIEGRRSGSGFESRLNGSTLDRRREALRELSEAEDRLAAPGA